MKSIKPGRGPSMMSAFMCVVVGIFGVFWTVFAISIGGGFMAPFGIIFIVIAVVNAVYNLKNATGKNRYSEFDIVENGEEPDPLNERFSDSDTNDSENTDTDRKSDSKFCPF